MAEEDHLVRVYADDSHVFVSVLAEPEKFHMSESHDPNLKQARVHFPRTRMCACSAWCMSACVPALSELWCPDIWAANNKSVDRPS